MKINGALRIETSQGVLEIRETSSNVEVSFTDKRSKEEIIGFRVNRNNQIKDFKTGKRKSNRNVGNPYVGVWLAYKFVSFDLVKQKITENGLIEGDEE